MPLCGKAARAADFARIVDILDKHGASFVSVTQAFNTTNSMGRLTLNVLLSFAQFEREVTSERIRDKFAASKKRGMWMGGVVPLGYEVCDRKLRVLPGEARRVRHIFDRYLVLGSVYALQAELAARGIKTKPRILSDGRNYGDKNFSRGALYQMLRNKIYIGEISHRGIGYPGEHGGIIDRDIFDRVGALLDGNRVDHKHATRADNPSLLAGIIWDDAGRRMTPNHANKRNGARYRYYISAQDKERPDIPVARIPAGDIENIVIHQLRQHTDLTWDGPTPSRELILAAVDRIIVSDNDIELRLHDRTDPICIAASLVRRSGETRIAVAPENAHGPRKDEALIKLIVRAHQARKALADPINTSVQEAAAQLKLSVQYFCALVRLGHLAPDITATILDGRQPAHINRQYLARINNLPIDWKAQRTMLGFA